MTRRPLPHAAVPLLLVAALLAPAASAGVPVHGQLTVASAQTQGPGTVLAPLSVAVQDHRPGVDARADPAFGLFARSLRVETYSFDPALHSPVGNRITVDTQISNESYVDASVQGVANRDGYQWSLFPLHAGDAQVEAASACATLAPSATAQVTEESKVRRPSPDETVTAGTATAIAWTDCSGAAALKVTGTFLLMLWEWDATLHTAGQDREIPSGQGRSSADPAGTPASQSVLGDDRQRYLYVEGGTLTIPHWSGGNSALFLGPDAQANPATGLRLHGANGSLAVGAQAPDLAAATLDLQGSLDLRLTGTGVGQPLLAQVAGRADRLLVDGTAFAIVAPRGPALRAPGWAVALGLGGAALAVSTLFLRARPLRHYRRAEANGSLAAASLATTRRERRGAGYGLLAHHAAQAGRNRLALLYCRLAGRLLPGSLDVPLTKAVALHRLHRYRDALEVHRLLQGLVPSGPDNAALACHSARMCVQMGDHEQAVEWLRHALAEDPALARQEAARPVFNALLEFPWFKAVRQAAASDWDPSVM